MSSRSLPVMMRDTSRTSLISCSCSRAFRSMVSRTAGRRSGSITPPRTIWVYPSTAFNGVRSSCDSVARNSSFRRFADSASCLAAASAVTSCAITTIVSTLPSSASTRLIHEIEIAVLGRALGAAVDDGLDGLAEHRLSERANAIEDLEDALALQLGERGSNRETDDVAPADQIAISRIGQLEHVIRTGQHRHGHGGVCEEARHPAGVLLLDRCGSAP